MQRRKCILNHCYLIIKIKHHNIKIQHFFAVFLTRKELYFLCFLYTFSSFDTLFKTFFAFTMFCHTFSVFCHTFCQLLVHFLVHCQVFPAFSLSPANCQFHQHSMRFFFVQKCFQLFSSYILALEFLAINFCTKNVREKR